MEQDTLPVQSSSHNLFSTARTLVLKTFPDPFLPLSLHPCSHKSPLTFLLTTVAGPLFSQLFLDPCFHSSVWMFVLSTVLGLLIS